MREIKFRAWDRISKVMYFSGNSIKAIWETLPKIYDDGNFVLMQYTGLHDKNGKEIYEGDIVKDNTYGVGKIVWLNQMAGYDIDFGEKKLIEDMLDYDKVEEYFKTDTEIIGNIYENPELIK